uniref:Thyroid stimulating hormone receptor n=1 Tax=Gadus morhua TaxID=8049 RepID=A0A8C5B258_GADMO
PVCLSRTYQRVSVCLPMDVETAAARVYVVLVLSFNILAFTVVVACYLHIYCMVHNPRHQSSRHDASMAQRMAVLIFTNFLCVAPISFYGLSALHRPLITITDSKVLLVLFFPLNSCTQPFLYALLTRAFQWDAAAMLSRVGLWRPQAPLLYCISPTVTTVSTVVYCISSTASTVPTVVQSNPIHFIYIAQFKQTQRFPKCCTREK